MSTRQDTFLRWAPRVTVGLCAIVFVLVGVAIYTLIHYQPKTACQSDPAGKECQQLKVESDKFRTPRSACVITRLAGLGCPALEDRRRSLPNDDFPTGKGDRNAEAASPAPSAGSDSGPSGGSPAPHPDPAPDPSSPPPAPDPPSPPSPSPPSPPSGADALHDATQAICTTTNSLGVPIPVVC